MIAIVMFKSVTLDDEVEVDDFDSLMWASLFGTSVHFRAKPLSSIFRPSFKPFSLLRTHNYT
jgi:hypothetical protein